MKLRNYSLPDWYMISGETKVRSFVLKDEESGDPYEVPSGEAEFLVYDFVDYTTQPIIRKNAIVRAIDDSGYYECVLMIGEDDTLGEYGKYIYQISFDDQNGNLIKARGILYIDGDNSEEYASSSQLIYTYRGSVETYSLLPKSNLRAGDVYTIERADAAHNIAAGDDVVWDGTKWVLLNTVITSDQIDDIVNSIS